MTEPLFVTNDGEIPFLRPQKGVDPVADLDLVTKQWAEANLGGSGGDGITEGEAQDLIDDSIAAHEAAGDPHPGYASDAEAAAAAASAVSTHEAAGDPHTQYVQKAAGAFITAAPTSAVAATPGSNQLTRAAEVDAAFTSLIGTIASLLAFKSDVGHGHDADEIALDDSGWSGALSGSGISTAQEAIDWVDSNVVLPSMVLHFWMSVAATFLNLVEAEAFFFLSAIRRIDLTKFRRVRFHGTQHAAAASGTYVRLKYATSAPTTLGGYAALGDSSTQVALTATTSGSVTLLTSGWIDIAASARADVYLAPTIGGGDSAADPIFGSLYAEFEA